MDLPAALTFSRFATHALAAEPGAKERLAAALDQPFAWNGIEAELAQLVEPVQLAKGTACASPPTGGPHDCSRPHRSRRLA
jgi:hypothetical protein